MRLLALVILLTLLGCAPDALTAVRMQSSVDHFQSRETTKAWVGTLQGQGTSAFFTSSVLPVSTYTVHTSGHLWVARGAVQMTFIDREGRTQTVRAAPGAPGEWTSAIRAVKTRDKGTGFHLRFEPLDGRPPQADGVVLEVTYGPG